MGGVIHTPHTSEPLQKPGLNIHKATKLALKLHALCVQYFDVSSSTRRVLEKTSLKSCQPDQQWGTASYPLDPCRFLSSPLGGENTLCLGH
eukprot:1157813-Pelagomonas_calceolata.AAC.8